MNDLGVALRKVIDIIVWILVFLGIAEIGQCIGFILIGEQYNAMSALRGAMSSAVYVLLWLGLRKFLGER